MAENLSRERHEQAWADRERLRNKPTLLPPPKPVEPNYAYWCGRLQIIIQDLLRYETLGDSDLSHRLAREALAEIDAELEAWRNRERT